MSGSITLRLVTPQPSASQSASGPSASTQATESAPLQSLRVTVDGPTPKAATFQCADTCEGTIDGLDPGSYSVIVEGLIGAEVDHFGQTSGVNVVAGQNSTATISFQSFQPVLNAFPQDTTEVLRFTVAFGAVPTATGYVVEYAQDPGFSGATSVTISGTSTEVVVAEEAQYFVRVRATNDVVTAGRWSASGSLVALQGVATVTLTPGTPTVVDGATQQFTAEARDGDNNIVGNVTFFWSSSDHDVVTIDQTGLATTRGLGQATISAVGKGQPGSAAITVTFGPAAKVAFAAPAANGEPTGPLPPIEVRILDARDNLVTSAALDVTLALGANPSGGTLAGTATVTSAGGIAAFSTLSIDLAGNGYTLDATAGGLTGASTGPFDVALDFIAMSMGPVQAFACGVTRTGAAYCWGRGLGGQLGDGSFVDTNRPVRVVGGHVFTALTTGGVFSSSNSHACGLRVDGRVLCWGWGAEGELGNGGVANLAEPTEVSGGHTFVSVSAGSQHTCGVRDDGAALCWGAGLNGRLGNGAATQQNAPVLVSGGHTFSLVDAGGSHTCGVRATDNVVLCWGFGNAGALGTGGTIGAIGDALVPVAVAGAYTQVSAGVAHTCAVNTAGFVACWGNNANGQYGNGGVVSASTPTQAPHLIRFRRVSAGDGHSCGVTLSQEGWCWGVGGGFLNVGQLGNGSVAQALTPVLVSGNQSWVTIDASRFTSAGVSAGGGGFLWGNGVNGERGDGTTANTSTPVRVLGSR
jgi:alpha-tubulin suppressor-like RCC1 family protein